jgi:hypothetical protein
LKYWTVVIGNDLNLSPSDPSVNEALPALTARKSASTEEIRLDSPMRLSYPLP